MLKLLRPNDDNYEKYDYYMRAVAIVVILLGLVLTGYIAIQGIRKATTPEVTLHLQGVNGQTFAHLFNNVATPHVVMMLYTSDNRDSEHQYEYVMKMRKNQQFPRVSFFLVSLDKDPIDAIRFLEEQGITQADDFALYYVSPADAPSFIQTLTINGSKGFTSMPHTMLLDDKGRVQVEFTHVVSTTEMDRTVSILRRQDPNLNRQQQ